MIIEHSTIIGKTARIILDDTMLKESIEKKRYMYITGISYRKYTYGSDVRVKQKKTIIIDLKGHTRESLFGTFHDTTRNEIRRTQKSSVFSFRVQEDIERAYALYVRFERAQGRRPQKRYSFEQSLIFNAYMDGELVSSIACYDAKPFLRVRAVYSARLWADASMRASIGYATRALVYEICQYGIAHGYEGVDMGAANFDDPEKKGITQFKGSFGGRVVDEYTYEYASPLFAFVRRIRSVLHI